MREADRAESRSGRDLRPGDHWRPLAQHLAGRFARIGGSDEEMVRVAVTTILDAEHRLGSARSDFSQLAIPLVIKALRQHRREQISRRPGAVQPLPRLQLAIAAAEGTLCQHLRRSPTVTEVASHLDMAEHQIVTGLEAGWSAGTRIPAPRPNPA